MARSAALPLILETRCLIEHICIPSLFSVQGNEAEGMVKTETTLITITNSFWIVLILEKPKETVLKAGKDSSCRDANILFA